MIWYGEKPTFPTFGKSDITSTQCQCYVTTTFSLIHFITERSNDLYSARAPCSCLRKWRSVAVYSVLGGATTILVGGGAARGGNLTRGRLAYITGLFIRGSTKLDSLS